MKYIVSGIGKCLNIDSTEMSKEIIMNTVMSLLPNEHIYIEDISNKGRLAIWGVSETEIALDVQYTACCFGLEIQKTEASDFLENLESLVDSPEKYGLLRSE